MDNLSGAESRYPQDETTADGSTPEDEFEKELKTLISEVK